jgi:hypothetical protein
VFTSFKKNAIVAISGFTELVYERKIVLLNGEGELKEKWRMWPEDI